MKFALISHALPPGGSGQAMVIQRLLEGVSPDQYCLLSQQDHSPETGGRDYFGRLPGKYFHLPPEFPIAPEMAAWRRRKNILLGLGVGVFQRARRITEIMRSERCEAVVACTGGDMLNLPAGYIAGRRLGVPFYAYMFDDYANQLPSMKRLARSIEPLMLKKAAGIIAPNEFMRDELRGRYGVEAEIIRNPCDILQYEDAASSADACDDGDNEIKIVYTGGVYAAHYDAFRRLIAAIKLLGRPDVKLHIYTLDSLSVLKEEGICGPCVVFKKYQKLSNMARVQRRADILFLPLAFDSPFPELIKTSAPGKTGELLAARKPILVHAPPDSFVAWYFRKHECGLVVDESDPVKLAQGIERILSDEELRQSLGERAWARARGDFSAAIARAKFAQLLKLDILKA
jgi:glycosyltransferase involved in cell wall biosynthesis